MKFEMLDKLFYMLEKSGIKDFFDLDLFKHMHYFNNANDLFFALAKEINKGV